MIVKMSCLKIPITIGIGLLPLFFLIPFSTLASTWIDEVKEEEYVLCSNLPNQISPLSSPHLEGKSVTFFVSVRRTSTSSLLANIKGTLDDRRDKLREIGTGLHQNDEFNFEGIQWRILSIGESGFYARKANSQRHFLGYQYCSTSFVHLKLIKRLE